MRRLRASAGLRGLVRETDLRPGQLVLPLFVAQDGAAPADADASAGGQGPGQRSPGRAGGGEAAKSQALGATAAGVALPALERLSISGAIARAREAGELGLGGVLLFGVPAHKDADGTGAYDEEGIVQLAVQAIKRALPDGPLVITDVCLCEYTDHGHCGVVREDGLIDNDATLELLARVAVSHARAGADLVAPSDMMDGRVGALRAELDAEGYAELPILAYSAKFASAFYGPFRDAVGSAPASGDRRTHQLDPANGAQALREAVLDAGEGADMLMVKPALAYGDCLAAIARATGLPVAAYNVSGEYAMVRAGASAGLLDEREAVLEILTSLARAGASTIVTYHALETARWLDGAHTGTRGL